MPYYYFDSTALVKRYSMERGTRIVNKLLVKRGKVAVAVCSSAFSVLGRAQARSLGMPELPIAVIPHPFGTRSRDDVRALAERCVDDIVKTRDWYEQMFSMRPIYYKAEEPNAQAMLRFGNNTLYLRNIKRPGGKPYVEHFAFEIENYDQDRVEAELKSRGYKPLPDSTLGWTIQDPEGMRSEIAGRGLPEYISEKCNGRATDCPGGPRG